MTTIDAASIIRKRMFEARDWRNFHRERQAKGEFEAALAAHKMMWLRDLLYEITGELVPLKELNK